MNSFNKFLTNKLSVLLNEASDVSLHQMYDKIYGSSIVDRCLEVDKSKKKKFAEWLLKTLPQVANRGLDPREVIIRFKEMNALDMLFNTMVNASDFDIYSCKDVIEAMSRLREYQIDKNPISPSYHQDNIVIYEPENHLELQSLIKNIFKRTNKSDYHWCVIASAGDVMWDDYAYSKDGRNERYKFFLIYNKTQGELYLWNNNPKKDKEFNNWWNSPVDPKKVGGLTDDAMDWLNEQAGPNVDIYKIKYKQPQPMFTVMNGRYMVKDPQPLEKNKTAFTELWNDKLHRRLFFNFCSHTNELIVNNNHLCILRNAVANGDEREYTFCFVDEDNSPQLWHSDKVGYQKGFTIAVSNERKRKDNTPDIDEEGLDDEDVTDMSMAYIFIIDDDRNMVRFFMGDEVDDIEDSLLILDDAAKSMLQKLTTGEFVIVDTRDGSYIVEAIMKPQKVESNNTIILEMYPDFMYSNKFQIAKGVVEVNPQIKNPIVHYDFVNRQAVKIMLPPEKDKPQPETPVDGEMTQEQ